MIEMKVQDIRGVLTAMDLIERFGVRLGTSLSWPLSRIKRALAAEQQAADDASLAILHEHGVTVGKKGDNERRALVPGTEGYTEGARKSRELAEQTVKLEGVDPIPLSAVLERLDEAEAEQDDDEDNDRPAIPAMTILDGLTPILNVDSTPGAIAPANRPKRRQRTRG